MALIIPVNAWEPATPEIFSFPGQRSVDLSMRVIRQWNVETSPRYQRNDAGNTMCNIFLTDVTLAMNAIIPHWINPLDGSPAPMGHGNTELSANGTCDWLAKWGKNFGWNPTNLAGALEFSSVGKLAIATWKNLKKGPGHVAVFTSTMPGPRIAQAGGANFVDRSLASGFGQLPVTLYRHE